MIRRFYTEPEAIQESYNQAKVRYAQFGIDTDKAIQAALNVPLSLHCWQGDDVTGFEGVDELSGGGILATGNYPGRARNGDELRRDLSFAMSLIPGTSRLNLHALYAETGGKKVERDELTPEHFEKWMSWAKAQRINLDFNPSFFSHPKAQSGYTLANTDKTIRAFWIRHGKASRNIAAAMGIQQNSPVVNNIWIPDGSKDLVADRFTHRKLLTEALDEILNEPVEKKYIVDTLESKLFGIGSEAYVVGSHEFYMGYAVSRQIKLCLDMGHFHPTETITDKISALLSFVPGLLLHLSRGIRWDSDHVALYSDEIRDICRELTRLHAFDKVHVALDYFDASINRIAAWVIGARAFRKALLEAFLEPIDLIREAELSGRLHERLALMEEAKSFPIAPIWDALCLAAKTPVGPDWLSMIQEYEEKELSHRL
ncbi:L-rhamnose isomerase [Gracilinema caldarium]|uniref:L-rhamnose isomerase n=1 Tax=Gracilinema caldarium TaxID=215591 RepID=UPI0026F046ED|nr:L-rhamnose isomerase [Gracilinema caldarium]